MNRRQRKTRERRLRRYFKRDFAPRRWTKLFWIACGTLLIGFADAIARSLQSTAADAEAWIRNAVGVPARVGAGWSLLAPVFSREGCLAVAAVLVTFGLFGLFVNKFPRFSRGACTLACGAVLVHWAPQIGAACNVERLLGALPDSWLSQPQGLREWVRGIRVDETAVVRVAGWVLCFVGGLFALRCLLRPVPRDRCVDRWLEESIDRIWAKSLELLRIQPEDLITEESQRMKLVFPTEELIEGPDLPTQARSRLVRWMEFVVDSVRFWIYPESALEDEEDEESPSERLLYFCYRGRDRRWRFSEVGMIFVHLTDEFVGYYKCDYDFLRDRVRWEVSGHHFYEDVVAVWLGKEEAKSNKRVIQGEKRFVYQEFRIWLRGSENIEEKVPWKMFVPKRKRRSLFRRRSHERLDTDVDVLVRNLNAMLDDKKQVASQDHPPSKKA